MPVFLKKKSIQGRLLQTVPTKIPRKDQNQRVSGSVNTTVDVNLTATGQKRITASLKSTK